MAEHNRQGAGAGAGNGEKTGANGNKAKTGNQGNRGKMGENQAKMQTGKAERRRRYCSRAACDESTDAASTATDGWAVSSTADGRAVSAAENGRPAPSANARRRKSPSAQGTTARQEKAREARQTLTIEGSPLNEVIGEHTRSLARRSLGEGWIIRSALEVNPFLTISALTERIVENIIASLTA